MVNCQEIFSKISKTLEIFEYLKQYTLLFKAYTFIVICLYLASRKAIQINKRIKWGTLNKFIVH